MTSRSVLTLCLFPINCRIGLGYRFGRVRASYKPYPTKIYNTPEMRIGVILVSFVAVIFVLVVSRSALTGNHKKLNRQLDSCLHVADYVARSKVYSCQKTAQFGTLVSGSFADSFSDCIIHMDRIIQFNRDACVKRYSKR